MSSPSPLHDERAIENANDLFYRALEDSDLELMSSVWLHEDWVKCVHPGWELITGWEKVRESWQRIFSNTRGMRVAISDVTIRIEGDFALVNCSEHLALFLDSGSAPATATTTATNLFCRAAEKWLMVHHHASQIPGAIPVNESDTIQ